MKKLLFSLMISILTISFCSAQTSKPDTPKSQACVIVKRHVPKFGENMSRLHPHRPFDYVKVAIPRGTNGALNSVMVMYRRSEKRWEGRSDET